MKVGDLVQALTKLQHKKSGKWTSAKPFLSHDWTSGTFIAPGQNSKRIKSAVEDLRFAISDDELVIKYQQAIDELDIAFDDSVDGILDQDVDLDLDEAELAENGEIVPTHSIEVGERFEVYWSGDDEYYLDTIDSYDPDCDKHAMNYDDGDKDNLDMQVNVCRLL